MKQSSFLIRVKVFKVDIEKKKSDKHVKECAVSVAY